MHNNNPMILVAFDWYDYHIHAGIVRYAREKKWNLRVEFRQAIENLPEQWNGDGMIICQPTLKQIDTFEKLIDNSHVPTVLMEYHSKCKGTASISVDNKGIASLAVRHFLNRAYKNFMWIGDKPESPGNQNRLRCFNEALHKNGHSCDVVWWTDKNVDNQNPFEVVANALRSAKKPLALFAVSDVIASKLIHACLELGIKVPQDVAILGVDNDELYWDSTPVPLSSVDCQQNEKGYRAAKLLDKLINGTPAPAEPVFIAPLGIKIRASTDAWATNHPQVQKAIKLIQNNYHKDISVGDVARHAGMSREGMSKAFRSTIQQSPGAILRSYRLEHAKHLLSTTDFKLDVVAVESGFKCATRLCNIFRRELGQTPEAFRNATVKPDTK